MSYALVRRSRAVAPSFPSFDRSFERFFNSLGFEANEDEKSWTLSLDVPGVSREDLNITIDGAIVRF